MAGMSTMRKASLAAAAAAAAAALYVYRAQSRRGRHSRSKASTVDSVDRALSTHDQAEAAAAAAQSKKNKNRVAVDRQFLSRLTKLLKVLVPGIFSKEAGYIVLTLSTMGTIHHLLVIVCSLIALMT